MSGAIGYFRGLAAAPDVTLVDKDPEDVALVDEDHEAAAAAAPRPGTVPPLPRLFCATVGAIVTSLVTTPMEVVKTRLQLTAPGGRLRGVLSTAAGVVRAEGAPALWRGLAPSLLMSLPSSALYFTLYDELRWKLEGAGGGVAAAAPMLAGASCRGAVAMVVAPLELARTRAMATPGAGGAGGAVWRALRAEAAARGPGALWRGWAPTLARDVPFSALYWLAYERAKEALAPAAPRGAAGAWAAAFVCGLGAGVLAAAATTPFDVVKTRRQAAGGGGDRGAQQGLARALTTVWREEGARGLMAGATMRMARVGPACAIMISSYELGKHVFRERVGEEQRATD
jgi:solute carrier family 25 protein 39/40